MKYILKKELIPMLLFQKPKVGSNIKNMWTMKLISSVIMWQLCQQKHLLQQNLKTVETGSCQYSAPQSGNSC